MEKCSICGSEYKTLKGLGLHITHFHSEITKEEYYNKHINKVSSLCKCGNKKKFRGLGEGYRKYCSISCRSKYETPTAYWKNKKQPKKLIEKRISSTNQTEKEKSRKSTMIERYNVENPSQIESIKKERSESYKGRPWPKTKETIKKIIESKRNNGTLNHSEKTKYKIRKSVKNTVNSPNFDKSKFINNNSGGICGYYNNLFFRSSLELSFLVKNKDKNIESAENKKFEIYYLTKNKESKKYYPDFYLKDEDLIVEIKPTSMLNYSNNQLKFSTAKTVYNNFKVITEKDIGYLTKSEIQELIDNEKLKLTDSSLIKFNKYRH